MFDLEVTRLPGDEDLPEEVLTLDHRLLPPRNADTRPMNRLVGPLDGGDSRLAIITEIAR